MRELSSKAKAMLSRLPDNLREAVMLMAQVIRRNAACVRDKAPERLETAANGALISVVTNQQETRE